MQEGRDFPNHANPRMQPYPRLAPQMLKKIFNNGMGPGDVDRRHNRHEERAGRLLKSISTSSVLAEAESSRLQEGPRSALSKHEQLCLCRRTSSQACI